MIENATMHNLSGGNRRRLLRDKGKGETPQCEKHEEAHPPPAESEGYFRSECYTSTIMTFGCLINKNSFVPAPFDLVPVMISSSG